MLSPITSILICVAAIWLTQRLLTIRQVVDFRKQLLDLRRNGQVSVGTAKKIGRRVYVGLAFDERGKVTAALVLRGLTVFSRGRDQPALIGCRATDLTAGHTPSGLPELVAGACRQSAELLLAGRRPSATRAITVI